MPATGHTLLRRAPRLLAPLALAALLGGCEMTVLNPAGDIALQQRNLIIFSTVLMLLIVVPVIVAALVFAWRYRASNESATYEPDWDHSAQLELLIWSAPLLIIICLGAATWTGSHLLDPYRPIGRIQKGVAVPAGARPLDVEVVSLDWKWLFIYPEQGIATVNELVAPVNRPLRFRLTSTSVMNTFYAPTLAGMIYTMPSMQTKLHAVVNRPGDYWGYSANYSGAGFSHMRFTFYARGEKGFDDWVARVKAGGGALNRANYLKLEKPSEKVPVMRFAAVDRTIFDAVVNQCVRPGTRCMSDLMKMDRHDPSSMQQTPGGGAPGRRETRPLTSGDAGAVGKNPSDVQQRSGLTNADNSTL
jgi:cytochrome o ubiquinol oxidase subunit II